MSWRWRSPRVPNRPTCGTSNYLYEGNDYNKDAGDYQVVGWSRSGCPHSLAGREALRRNAGYTEDYPDDATRASCLSSFTSVFDRQWRKRGCFGVVVFVLDVSKPS